MPLSIGVRVVKVFSSTVFAVRREGTPAVLLVWFSEPPFGGAEGAARAVGSILQVRLDTYDLQQKAFRVLAGS